MDTLEIQADTYVTGREFLDTHATLLHAELQSALMQEAKIAAETLQSRLSLTQEAATIVNTDSRLHQGQWRHAEAIIHQGANNYNDAPYTSTRRQAVYIDELSKIVNFINGCRG